MYDKAIVNIGLIGNLKIESPSKNYKQETALKNNIIMVGACGPNRRRVKLDEQHVFAIVNIYNRVVILTTS